MKPIPVTPLTLDLARRIIWFEPPEVALSDPIRFMAYAMTYARHEDMQEIRRHVSDDDIRAALDHAPAGIIDPRSWAYWNARMGRYPAPPPPVRMFAASPGSNDQKSPREHQAVGLNSGGNADSEETRHAAVRTWRQRRAQEPAKCNLEEVRRHAREDWLDKYGRQK